MSGLIPGSYFSPQVWNGLNNDLAQLFGVAGQAGVNLLRNALWQWIQVSTSGGLLLPAGTAKVNPAGTGFSAPLSVTSYTVSANVVTFTVAANPLANGIVPGDALICASGGETNLKEAPMHVLSTTGTTVVARLPLGLKTAGSNTLPATIQSISTGDANGTTQFGPDWWIKTPSLKFIRDLVQVPPNGIAGAALWLQKGASTLEIIEQWLAGLPGGIPTSCPFPNSAVYEGAPVAVACWIKPITVSGAGPYLTLTDANGQSVSQVIASQNGWNLHLVTRTPGSGSTFLKTGFAFAGNSGDSCFVGNPVMVAGASLIATLMRALREKVYTFSHYNLATFLPSAITSPNLTIPTDADANNLHSFIICPYAETYCNIGPHVTRIDVQLEGGCHSVVGGQVFQLGAYAIFGSTILPSPTIGQLNVGPKMVTYNADQLVMGSGSWQLSRDGGMGLPLGIGFGASGQSWAVTFDIVGGETE